MNPVVIFTAVLLWGWLWGLLLGVPILMIIKAVCDHVEDVRLRARKRFHPGEGFREVEVDTLSPPQHQRRVLRAIEITGDLCKARNMAAIVEYQLTLRLDPAAERHDLPILRPPSGIDALDDVTKYTAYSAMWLIR